MTENMKYALITGGSSGIGLAFSKQFAKRSYNLLLVGNRDEENRTVAETLSREFQVQVHYLTIDLAHCHAAQQTFDFCKTKGIEVEVLVNNAGIFFFDAITNENIARSETMVHLHVTTPTLLCSLFGKAMKQRGKGYILNVSSISAWMPYPGLAIYAASKRYVKEFSRAIRYEFNDFGIKVCAVCPGAVDTSLYKLSPNFRRVLRKWGVMHSTDALAKKGVNALFRGKVIYIPGLINRIVKFLVLLIPPFVINYVKRKAKLKQLMK